MAIEDGAALGALLSNIRSKDEIPARLQLFQQLRIDRVSAMVIFSSVGQDESARIADIARLYVKGPLPSEYLFAHSPKWGVSLTFSAETPEDYHVYNFTPNVIRDAIEVLEKYKTETLGSTDHQFSVSS